MHKIIFQYPGNAKKRHLKNSQYSRKTPMLNFPDYCTAPIFKQDGKMQTHTLSGTEEKPSMHKSLLAKVQNPAPMGKNAFSIIL